MNVPRYELKKKSETYQDLRKKKTLVAYQQYLLATCYVDVRTQQNSTSTISTVLNTGTGTVWRVKDFSTHPPTPMKVILIIQGLSSVGGVEQASEQASKQAWIDKRKITAWFSRARRLVSAAAIDLQFKIYYHPIRSFLNLP